MPNLMGIQMGALPRMIWKADGLWCVHVNNLIVVLVGSDFDERILKQQQEEEERKRQRRERKKEKKVSIYFLSIFSAIAYNYVVLSDYAVTSAHCSFRAFAMLMLG